MVPLYSAYGGCTRRTADEAKAFFGPLGADAGSQ